MQSFQSLFYQQTYQDAIADYERALKNESFACWDYIVLTAANQQQAAGFEKLLQLRTFPKRTKVAVVSDPEGKRIGSGGATLNVLKFLREREKSFEGLRILVIHSGGDSKRIPQYSAIGKLFSPVPHILPDGRSSTLFDEFMMTMAGVPSRMKEGILLLSGDVLLLFNPLQIDFTGDAAAVSFKEKAATGKNHGVYLNGDDGYVARCLQKYSEEDLRTLGAVNEQDCVDIDTGALLFSPAMADVLYDFANAGFINERVRLSLYSDFLYPLASASTKEQYLQEKTEGAFSDELLSCRQALWEALRPYRLKLLRLAPAKFLHFGTVREVLKLMTSEVNEYASLGWKRCINSMVSGGAGYDSITLTSSIGKNVYLEVSKVHDSAVIGEDVFLSNVEITEETIPSRVVLHGMKLTDGRFAVRIWGIDDNPKEKLLFGTELGESLWTAKLFPICQTMKEAVKAALNLYDLFHEKGDRESWERTEKISLSDGFRLADLNEIITWNQQMLEQVRMEQIVDEIIKGKPVSEMMTLSSLTDIQQKWLKEKLGSIDFSVKTRFYYYLGKMTGEAAYISEAFHLIRQSVIGQIQWEEKTDLRIRKKEHQVCLPLRVNWGGGWSDTPPYCLENGGTVLNAAILLNGQKPVEVTLVKLKEKKIVFDSRDMDVHGEFEAIEPLQMVGNPYDPFVLQKASLLACGIIPREKGNLSELLERFGGGFLMKTEVIHVPKGSGLGTSSILAGACVKALFEFFGLEYDDAALYRHVSAVEQIMSTGGGWQDQIGGLSDGIKYITSLPGLEQDIRVQRVAVPERAQKELQKRFALIYTGQRRLARNLLRDVIGRYLGNEKDSLFALNEIQRVAALMRFELERGQIDAFARLLDEHWKLSKMVDQGSSNTLIDQIFTVIDDLVDGRMVCGAGGGGFLQVILKKGITREDVHARLKQVFQDSDIDIYDAQLI